MHTLTKQEKGVKIAAYIILTLMSMFAVIPFWLLVSSSFSD